MNISKTCNVARTVRNALLMTKYFHQRVTSAQEKEECCRDLPLIQNQDFEGTDCLDVEIHYKTCDVFGMDFEHWGGFQYLKYVKLDLAN